MSNPSIATAAKARIQIERPNAAKVAALDAAEKAKQNAVAQARDTFRATGEANISL
jgi:hypothetical protein